MTEYIIPFKQGDIIAEFGGGDQPIFHPNIDIRQLQNVDMVIDFNKPLPIPDNSYNGVFSKYLLEHLSWRRIKPFLKEIYRILKDGGTVVLITANLLEQAKVLINTPNWNENLINMIFGGQRFDENRDFDEEWDQNAHHSGFSPEYIISILKDIGFQEIKIIPIQTDVGPTDMVVEFKKPNKIKDNNHYHQSPSYISHPFNRSYFEGGTYTGEGYRDFNVHYNTLKMILDRKPESVIDIGGARGYIVKKLNDLNIPAICIDISEHCYHTRTTDNFVLHDLTKIPYPFKDKEFDLAVSISVLEHIPEEHIPSVLKEIARISKRGFHGITFNHQPNDIDNTHVNIKPMEWWKKAFGDVAISFPDYKYDILDKEDTEKGIPIIPVSTDNLVKLNIGSFINMFHHSWQNIDIIDLTDFANQNGYIFKHIDITKTLPYNDNSVDLIISSHLLEHLDRYQGKIFVSELIRVLKPNGILRVSIPDTELLVKKYLENQIGEYKYINIGVEESIDNSQSLYELLLAGHKTIYDYDSISKLLSDIGFINISRMTFNKSISKEIQTQTIDTYPTLSLYIEAIKPEIIGPIITKGPITTINSITNQIIKEKKLIKENSRLKIALISTPFFSIPPKGYSGLEQILWDLAYGLYELGHEVTMFGPEGSISTPNGHIVITGPSINSVNIDWFEEEKKRYEVYKDIILKNPDKYDIIHDSTWFGFPYLLRINNPRIDILHHHHGHMTWDSPPPVQKPNITTISKWMKDNTEYYFRQKGYNISCQFVHNGIDISKYIFKTEKSDRLLFVGRLSTFKKPEIAIEIARKTGHKLDIIGGSKFVDSYEFVKQLERSIEGDPNIKLYKDVTHEFKIEKMQDAKAILIPSKMGEPLNLVSIEGQSCGAPIICTNDGGLPETVVHGKTGFICNDIQEMIDAIDKIHTINPIECRRNIETNFNRQKMAKEFEKLYYRILNNNCW